MQEYRRGVKSHNLAVYYQIMNIVAVDFMNMAHRARSGFKLGPAPVVFNFFRQFRSLVEKLQPSRVYIALEGRPVHRHTALPEYKANRSVTQDDPRAQDLQKFFLQKDVIVSLLEKYFPVSVVRHPQYECDDTISNLVMHSSTSVPWTVVSSDTDFIQLLQMKDNVKLYNPVQDKFIDPPDAYDYVTWKALRGDPSDNIPGIPGVGDKTAVKLASDPELLKEFVSRPEVEPIFTRNYNLVSFSTWREEERSCMTSSSPQKDWGAVRQIFTDNGFTSLVKDGAWDKFVNTFDSLWSLPC